VYIVPEIFISKIKRCYNLKMDKKVLTTVEMNISGEFLWGILLLLILAIGIFSWILVHHWNYYGIKGNNKVFAKSLYFIGLITFFVISILLLGSYELIK
jgi:hypothetical protein